MTKGLHVPSEIGKLRKVCLHRPGDELLNLPPDELSHIRDQNESGRRCND